MSTTDGSVSRETVVSAANLLLVSLLKLNRGLVPILLRWIRGRRTNWIKRASQDVYSDLLSGKNTRHLNGPQIRMLTYGLENNGFNDHNNDDFDDDTDDDDDHEMEAEHKPPQHTSLATHAADNASDQDSESGEHDGDGKSGEDDLDDDEIKLKKTGKEKTSESSKLTKRHASTSTASPVPSEHHAHAVSSKPKAKPAVRSTQNNYGSTEIPVLTGDIIIPSHAHALVRQSLGLEVAEEDEITAQYIKLLIAQEEKHRREMVSPAVFSTVLNGWVTVLTLILYSTIILVLMGIFFPMEPGRFITFAFTLVATATVSEADKLMQAIKKKKTETSSSVNAKTPLTDKKKKKNKDDTGDTTKATQSPKGSLNAV